MIKDLVNAIVNMNPEQRKVIRLSLFSATGPAAWLLSRHFGLSQEEIKIVFDFAGALTPLIGTVLLTVSRSSGAQMRAIGNMHPSEKAAALASISPEMKVAAATTVPGVAVVADTAVAPPSVVAMANDPFQVNVTSSEETKR